MSADSAKTIDIIGPEGTWLRFPLAGVLERVTAFSTDLAFLVVTSGLVLCGLGASLSVGSSFLVALGLVLFFAVRHGYFLFFETLFQGATPGKRILGLRVVSRDGGRLRLEAIIARNLMRDLELFVPMVVLMAPESVVGPAPWWMRIASGLWALVICGLPLYTRDRSRAGDLVGGTVVVAIPRVPLIRDESVSAVSAGILFQREELGVYGELELETLAALLRSFDEGRATVDDMRLVAQTIQRRIGFGGSEPTRVPLQFLRSFYAAQRAELERRLVLGRRKSSKLDAG